MAAGADLLRTGVKAMVIVAAALAAVVPATPRPMAADDDTARYFELWQPDLAAEPLPDDDGSPSPPPGDDALERSQIRLEVAASTIAAEVADWCSEQRTTTDATLATALLRQAPYEPFATSRVPLAVELLIDDVELRYALGTVRPDGVDGRSFPFFELCPLGFGRRSFEVDSTETGSLEVVHLSNARGQQIVIGLYDGEVAASERAFLAATLGYGLELPDPAGLLVLGQGEELPVLLLVRSPDGDAHRLLRSRIVR